MCDPESYPCSLRPSRCLCVSVVNTNEPRSSERPSGGYNVALRKTLVFTTETQRH
jgi:hypothetical protein